MPGQWSRWDCVALLPPQARSRQASVYKGPERKCVRFHAIQCAQLCGSGGAARTLACVPVTSTEGSRLATTVATGRGGGACPGGCPRTQGGDVAVSQPERSRGNPSCSSPGVRDVTGPARPRLSPDGDFCRKRLSGFVQERRVVLPTPAGGDCLAGAGNGAQTSAPLALTAPRAENRCCVSARQWENNSIPPKSNFQAASGGLELVTA